MLRACTLALALLAVQAISTHAWAAVSLQGTRVVFDGAKSSTTIVATNEGQAPALTQVWIDDGDPQAKAGSQRLPFALTPTTRRIEPGTRQSYRLSYMPQLASQLPQDRESIFYFNLLDIPPRPANSQDQNLLQIAVRTRVKLFYRPKGLTGNPAAAAGALQWVLAERNGTSGLEVTNPSAFHLSFNALKLPNGAPITMNMLAPGQTEFVPLPKGTTPPRTFTFTWLDDYGAVREQAVTLGH
ncbi:molecular chaperone [Stenotrophomonas maltophilia]|uniref:Molecular chaperone n=2 Tax=Stenotrophomonas maltophilia TaxID=40324 RepID=A0A270NIR0_STEMA|nr:molecular chaperone [Stenotrophomonas maltophilia]PAM71931.1 molecular chaperone [Stenotrophomonas maltophilia]PAM71932.1 molecular chaperone [Stenotrophomonas maltophilia]